MNREEEQAAQAALASQPLQADAQSVGPIQPPKKQDQTVSPIGGNQSGFTNGNPNKQPQQDPNKSKKGVGTGAASLQKFLNANEGQNMMGQIGKQAGQQAGNIQKNVAAQKSALMQQIEANRGRFQDAYGQVMGTGNSTQYTTSEDFGGMDSVAKLNFLQNNTTGGYLWDAQNNSWIKPEGLTNPNGAAVPTTEIGQQAGNIQQNEAAYKSSLTGEFLTPEEEDAKWEEEWKAEQAAELQQQQDDEYSNAFNDFEFGDELSYDPTEQKGNLAEIIAGLSEGQDLEDMGLTEEQITQIRGLYSDSSGTGDAVDFTDGLGYDPATAAKLQREAANQAAKYGNLNSEDSRKQTLREVFGQGREGYTRGQNKIDSLLMGQGVPESEQNKFLQKMKEIGEGTQNSFIDAQRDGQNAIGDLKNDENSFEQKLKEQLENSYGTKMEDDPNTTIDESQLWNSDESLMGGLKNKAELEETLRDAWASGEMNKEQIQAIMGNDFNPSSEDFSLYNADMSDGFGPAYDNLTPEMMATTAEDSQIRAYSDLMGQGNNIVQEPGKIVPGEERFKDFRAKVAERKEAYQKELFPLEDELARILRKNYSGGGMGIMKFVGPIIQKREADAVRKKLAKLKTKYGQDEDSIKSLTDFDPDTAGADDTSRDEYNQIQREKAFAARKRLMKMLGDVGGFMR